MKTLVILALALPLIGNGQSESVLADLLGPASSQSTFVAQTRMHNFVTRLKNKKNSSEIAFLRKVFHQTQRNFLGQYDPYAEFNELFSSGKYDCLTATSLFSLVLDELHFKYRIFETNYHIFLVVNTSSGDVLLETTDRFSGFVKDANAIQVRIGSYRQALPALDNKDVYQYHFDLYHDVTPKQLPGLLYYNQAVKAFNAGRLEKSAELLVKAKAAYDTPRISEFSSILLHSVAASKLDDQTKQRIVDRFKNSKPAVLASIQ